MGILIENINTFILTNVSTRYIVTVRFFTLSPSLGDLSFIRTYYRIISVFLVAIILLLVPHIYSYSYLPTYIHYVDILRVIRFSRIFGNSSLIGGGTLFGVNST